MDQGSDVQTRNGDLVIADLVVSTRHARHQGTTTGNTGPRKRPGGHIGGPMAHFSHSMCLLALSPKNLPSILTTVTDGLKGMAIWMLSTSPCSCINLIPPIGVRPDDAVKGVHDHSGATCYFRRALTTARTSKRFKST
jgi:hypothetical protein